MPVRIIAIPINGQQFLGPTLGGVSTLGGDAF
jgi:hypothetical protein